MSACKEGHLDVVKYVCEIGGKELVTATDVVSSLDGVLRLCMQEMVLCTQTLPAADVCR
jgi:hypothetical protein